MTLSEPILKSTVFNANNGIWKPTSLDNMLKEIDHISKVSTINDSLILYRGHANTNWPLDSTFVRNGISRLFGIMDYTKLPSHVRRSVTFHRSITSLLLMNFEMLVKPSTEAFEKEASHDIDPVFELCKNIQQYPENYAEVPFIKGTNLIDWTATADIALYFATFDGYRDARRISKGDGAIWVYDASSTGKIQQVDKMQKILDKMNTFEFLNGEGPLPLMFHPQKQANQHRASNQKPIYIAQMNFSFSLSEVWEQYEKDNAKKVVVKIQIHENIKNELEKYLKSRGITEEYVYPH